MGPFEFLMVLISVVIGLALTEILTGAANLLRVRESVRFHWIHVLFQVGRWLMIWAGVAFFGAAILTSLV